MRHRSLASASVPFLVGALVLAGQPEDGGQPVPQETLARLARLAELYRDTSLSFACEETITYRGHGIDSDRHRFDYVFERSESGKLRDYRTKAGKSRGKKIPGEIDPEGYGIPAFVRNAYLFVFVFREGRWPYHEYRLAGRREVLQRPAIGIKFDPRPPYVPDVNEWHGTAWIDAETTELLQVEAYELHDYRRLQDLDAHLAGELRRVTPEGTVEVNTTYTIQRITTDFSVEKNGIRFPGRVLIERDRHKVRERDGLYSSKRIELVRVEQTYSNYQFFRVHTRADVEKFLRGPSATDSN